ncbi:hypothetical protein [Kocuria rosea]|uniref:hypothetical protein n=1 Tax=Kocuria rosea TaxID=1275 RepID=UPI000E0E4FA9|nr:hypothetical protein [Kocuria rosea]
MPSPTFHSVSAYLKRTLTLLFVGSALGLTVILAVPQNLGLWGYYPVVQLDALPLAWIMVLIICIISACIVLRGTLAVSGVCRTLLQIMVILLVSAVLVEGALFYRAGGFLPARFATAELAQGDLTVLSFNALDTEADDVVRAVVDSEADAVMLVETTRDVAEAVVLQLQREGITNQLFMGSGTALQGDQEVAVIVTGRLGVYHEVPSCCGS